MVDLQMCLSSTVSGDAGILVLSSNMLADLVGSVECQYTLHT